MSYSFSVRGPTKGEALKAVIAELDMVVAQQPEHAADRAQAEAAAEAFLDIVPAADGKDFCIAVAGYVGWHGLMGGTDHFLTAANISVSVWLADAGK